ncbi:DUF2007 domain-containing protein [Spongiibacter taiwanensis]|uniref:putative signal transducing protein n=1 Tax=Spongiibacter taiwanensis TaxID=1748242 RepID=UPI002035D96B|nr:DUF2007 domain-containing protein [Spongiibacter taiwanensis]USA42193.1 DUF2007 domain-containing protein [Spongiibacter taiwanensis]
MLTTVARFSFPYEAQIARARLDAEGIPAFVADEQTINMQWLFSNALGGVRLQVPSAYEARAREVLAEDLSAEVDAEQGTAPARCARCGSENVAPFQRGRRWAFLVFLGLDFPLFPVKNTRKCSDCGHLESP